SSSAPSPRSAAGWPDDLQQHPVDDHQKTQDSERTRKSGAIVAAYCRGDTGDAAASSPENGSTETQSSPRAPGLRSAVGRPAGTPAALDLASAPRQAGRDFRVFTGRATAPG